MKMRTLIFLILLTVLGSCKKEDYRIKYTGNFYFTTDLKTFITDTTFTDSITQFHGFISLASESDKISIHSLPNVTFETRVNEDGGLPDPNIGAMGGGFGGHFIGTDSITFGSFVMLSFISQTKGKRE